jgi:hypothetical protein
LYVAAVAFTERDSRLCQSVQATPLLGSEKAREPLPEFHPTELYFVFATYINRPRADKSAGGLVPVQAQPLDNPFGTRLSPMSWGMFGGILTIIGKPASVGVAKAIAAC